MKSLLQFTLACSIVTLSGCGGGGGGAGGSSTPQSSGPTPLPEKELVFKFSEAPLEPNVFNMDAFSEDQETNFAPGDIINLTWKMELYYDDQSVPAFDEVFPYTAAVYLSEDGIFQLEEDVELFSVQCVFPSSNETACGQWASFRCDYAPGNQNVVSCTSLPLDRSQGIKDRVVDLTQFLDVIPKTAELLIVSCLDDHDKCDTARLGLQLN